MAEAYSIPRFRRTSYSQVSGYLGPGKWHIAQRRYRRHLLYDSIEALCGYVVKTPWRGNVEYRETKRQPTGEQCEKCKAKIKKMEQETEVSGG